MLIIVDKVGLFNGIIRQKNNPPPPQWEKTLKRAGNFNWWTYNSIEIKVGGIKINVIWGLYIPKTIRCIKIYF